MNDLAYAVESVEFLAVCISIPVGVSLLLASAIAAASYCFKGLTRRRLLIAALQAGATATSISVLAWVVGYATGISRDPVVSAIIPAAFGAIAAIGGLLTMRRGRAAVGAAVTLSFSVALFMGMTMGAHIRKGHEGMPPYEYLRDEALKEEKIKVYRETLGLAWPPPTYPAEGAGKKK